MLLENDRISPIAYKYVIVLEYFCKCCLHTVLSGSKLFVTLVDNDLTFYRVLERVGARALSSHLRTFADFLVFEFANSVGGQHVNKVHV